MKRRWMAAIGGAVVLVALGTGAAMAQADEAAVAQARAAGTVGEQADGYLGFAGAPSAAVRQAVDAINIKRRQIYTDIAAKQGATVQAVAAARGCDQLAHRVAPGEAYKAGASWAVRQGSTPVPLPGVCG